jgi:hypothetical protein
MADRREMWMATRKAVAPLLLLALGATGLAACGGAGEDTTTVKPPPVSASTADHLAKLSNRIASDLDEGATCDAAIAADEFKAAVEDADLAATLRPGVEQVATSLVNEVNCPPPPPPEPEKKKKEKHQEGDDHGGDHHDGHNGFTPPGHEKHGGLIPPGQEKLKGEPG